MKKAAFAVHAMRGGMSGLRFHKTIHRMRVFVNDSLVLVPRRLFVFIS